MRTITRATALVATLALAGALASCGDLAQETAGTAHNDADVEFTQMMILHHEGAVDMADVVATNASSDEIKELAGTIAAAQQPEIETMTSWLDAWGESAPATAAPHDAGTDEDAHPGGADGGGTDHDDADHADHGDMLMDGMDHETAMAELATLMGAEFDERFLELMLDHHEGAVHMAEHELDAGTNDAAKELARTIIDTQTAEIETMRDMLDAR